jgi:hypothetical protein
MASVLAVVMESQGRTVMDKLALLMETARPTLVYKDNAQCAQTLCLVNTVMDNHVLLTLLVLQLLVIKVYAHLATIK